MKRRIDDILQEVGYNFDDSKMYNEKTIIEITGKQVRKYFSPVRMCGERAYVVEGEKKTIIVWDCGNSWYQIIWEW